jgi:fatty-acyl-CoA synthase
MSTFYPAVGDLLDINAEKSPNNIALIDPGKGIELTYSEWRDQVVRFVTSMLEHGIQPGDRVASFLRDAVELPTSLFATSKVGGIFVPINFRLSPEELTYIVDNCAAKALIFDEDGREIVDRIRNRLKSVEVFIYTRKNASRSGDVFQKMMWL